MNIIEISMTISNHPGGTGHSHPHGNISWNCCLSLCRPHRRPEYFMRRPLWKEVIFADRSFSLFLFDPKNLHLQIIEKFKEDVSSRRRRAVRW